MDAGEKFTDLLVSEMHLSEVEHEIQLDVVPLRI